LIQTSEAIAFNGTIDCSRKNIFNLTGIEAFTALTYLNCTDNKLTSLDVSKNIALTHLYCSNNQLTTE
jgi:Leucine-rich repeat (LRR) protein